MTWGWGTVPSVQPPLLSTAGSIVFIIYEELLACEVTERVRVGYSVDRIYAQPSPFTR